jgi:phage terminase large subunit-like protein
LAFHAAGKTHRERLFLSGNQLGKSYCSAMEAAMHATGLYPQWWPGYRFDKPTAGWCAGASNTVLRETIQKLLLGNQGEYGTGCIPKGSFINASVARGVADLVDTIRVRHESGGVSTIGLKSYEAGREHLQGSTLDWCSNDEQVPEDVYSEILTRSNLANGPVWTVFTPIGGVDSIVRRFLYEKSPTRALITATIDDSPLYTEEQKQQIAESYLPHEREARLRGVPTMGSGRIFPIAEEKITCERRDIPAHWRTLGGLDFGYEHPFAAVSIAHDVDHDVVYVTRAYRIRQASAIIHAAALRHWGSLQWAWPQDGGRHTLEGSGISLADQYKDLGLDLLFEPAKFQDGGVSVEAGLMLMLQRFQTGHLKVFSDLEEWLEEYRLYHRKDGKVFKEYDDLLSATRYALMNLRYARTDATARSFNRREIAYPKQTYY